MMRKRRRAVAPKPKARGRGLGKAGHKIPSVREINQLVRRREHEEATFIRLGVLRHTRQTGHAYEHLRNVPEMIDLKKKLEREAKKREKGTPKTESGLKRDIQHLDRETSEEIKMLERARLPASEELKRLKRVRAALADEERRIEQMEKGILPGKGRKAIPLNRQQREWLHRREHYIRGQIRRIDTFLERLRKPKGAQKRPKGWAPKKAS